MKGIIAICFVFLIGEYNAQVSVYDCSVINPTVTEAEVNAKYEFHKQCIIFEPPQAYQFNQADSNRVTANESIRIKKGFNAGPYTDNGHMRLKIEDQSLFDVVVMDYTDLNGILKYEKLELGIELPPSLKAQIDSFLTGGLGAKINPYLDWEIKVFAEFTHSSVSGSYWVDGFYSKEYTPYMNNNDGNFPIPAFEKYTDAEYNTLGGYIEDTSVIHNFRIRFAPPKTGLWTCKIHIITNNGATAISSSPFSFNVIPSANKGYLKVGAKQRFFVNGDDTPFYPIGGSAPWPETNHSVDPVFAVYSDSFVQVQNITKIFAERYRVVQTLPRVYDKYRERLVSMASNGANMIRTIMSPHATDIEWERLGDYSKNLINAQEMDKILETAEDNGFYLLWNLQIHFVYAFGSQAFGDSWAWDAIHGNDIPFCYNDLIGTGDPTDFLTHTLAKKYYKQRLRYIMARWGYSTNIGLFELFSEHDAISPQGTTLSTFYRTGNNHQLFTNWAKEMGSYIKTHYNGDVHMLTNSYTTAKLEPFLDDATAKPILKDEVFIGEPFDVMSMNNYDINEPTFGKFWVNNVSKGLLSESFNSGLNTIYNFDAYSLTQKSNGQIDRTIKPVILSETGVLNLTSICDYNKIEMDRLMWHSLFSGLAGAFDWDLWYREPSTAGALNYAKQFMAPHSLDAEEWHPGAVKLKNAIFPPNNLQSWKYESNYAERMEGKTRRADLSYLRSGDRNYAIGVITNKTYNIYSVENCFDDTWEDSTLFGSWLQNLDEIRYSLPVNCKQQKLKLKGMNAAKYYINYFTPNDLATPVASSDDNGPNVKIEYTFSGNEYDYITVIMARKKNTSWIPTQADSIALTELLKVNFNDTTAFDISIFKPQKDLISIFPVPSSAKVNIESNEYTNLTVLVMSTDGKQQDSFTMKRKKHTLDISNYQNGVYFLKFYLGEDLIETKKLVKL